MNRVVTISGVMTNSQIVGGETFNTFGDSKNVVRLMFSVLKDLVRGAVPCEVITNYGNYSPVIFTKFRTKLVAGKTDIMEFTMSGEEVQLATTINGSKPTLLVFKAIDPSKVAARVSELSATGIFAGRKVLDSVVGAESLTDDATLESVVGATTISEATVDLNEDFQIETLSESGETSISTYQKISDGFTDGSTSFLTSLGIPPLYAGVVTELVKGKIEERVDTEVGKLKQDVYGFVYGITGVNGDSSFGQELLSVGVDTFVVGAMEVANDAIYSPEGVSLPSSEDILTGATNLGSSLVSGSIKKHASTIITKVTEAVL
tara:strand:- start:13 stop:969 length:957 start_codon:yes stop_codon:yes gene_type:complete